MIVCKCADIRQKDVERLLKLNEFISVDEIKQKLNIGNICAQCNESSLLVDCSVEDIIKYLKE